MTDEQVQIGFRRLAARDTYEPRVRPIHRPGNLTAGAEGRKEDMKEDIMMRSEVRAETMRKYVMVGIAFCVWGLLTPNTVPAQSSPSTAPAEGTASTAPAESLTAAPPPPKVAALLNIHVQQTLVHLYCDRKHTECEATFYCDGRPGGLTPTTDRMAEWKVSIPASGIFPYYQGKTESGEPAGFGDVWRRVSGSTARSGRTTCIVRSNDPVEARAYTQWGVPEWVPASNRIHPPEPYPSARLSDLTVSVGTLSPAFASDITSYTLTTQPGERGAALNFTPTAEESRAEIKVQGKTAKSGEIIKAGDIPDGDKRQVDTATIAVTSYDGRTLNYYVRHTYIPPPSTSTTN